MAVRNRKTLIESFGSGQRPSSDDFRNLIESTVNILDDGFSKDAQTGIKLAPISEKEGTVMTFLQSMTEDGSRWEFDVIEKDLRISRIAENKKEQLILLKQDGNMELGDSDGEVHVKGTLRSDFRSGKKSKPEAFADGRWHDITEDLEGIHALEVICVMGERHTGKHAVLLAHATHCFGAKPRIRKLRSHYGAFGNKLQLRWVRSGFCCKLQVRTRFPLGKKIAIHSSATWLWENPLMEKL
jgi:hypothetical protein